MNKERERREAQSKALQQYEESQSSLKYWRLSNWRTDALAKARLKKLSERLEQPKRPVQAANESPDYKTVMLMASVTLNVVLIYAVLRLSGKL